MPNDTQAIRGREVAFEPWVCVLNDTVRLPSWADLWCPLLPFPINTIAHLSTLQSSPTSALALPLTLTSASWLLSLCGGGIREEK